MPSPPSPERRPRARSPLALALFSALTLGAALSGGCGSGNVRAEVGPARFPDLSPFYNPSPWLPVERATADPEGLAALLASPDAKHEERRGPLIPVVIAHLRPLWVDTVWNDDGWRVAELAQSFFEAERGAPRLAFRFSDADDNHEQIGTLFRWFESELTKPRKFARMLPATGRGPLMCVPYRGPKARRVVDRVGLPKGLEAVLVEDPASPETRLFQVRYEGTPIYCTVLTDLQSDQPLVFASRPAVPLGRLGWRMQLRAATFVQLYIDLEGRPLFYFVEN